MDYSKLVKKLDFPDGFTPPQELIYDDLHAFPLTRADIKEDLKAVNSSIKVIQDTRGGSWPDVELTEEFDLLDLAWHEREFRDKISFAYVTYDNKHNYIGCFYLYPMGDRTELSQALMVYDVDASWWVTKEAKNKGYYEKLYLALRQWLAKDFPFKNTYYSNKVIPK